MSDAHHNAKLTTTPQAGLPQAAAVLAYAGALAPIIGALIIWLRPADDLATAIEFLLVYGGALIVFFGGVRWGVAVMRPGGPSFASLLGGAIPLLMAFPVFLLSDVFTRFMIILVALPILLWDDLRATRRGSGAPDWYLGVRTPLTILMLISYAAAFAAVLLR
ncbi:MAG: DUF3429 domain-containing protein [Pseudomonadota bacterium]